MASPESSSPFCSELPLLAHTGLNPTCLGGLCHMADEKFTYEIEARLTYNKKPLRVVLTRSNFTSEDFYCVQPKKRPKKYLQN